MYFQFMYFNCFTMLKMLHKCPQFIYCSINGYLSGFWVFLLDANNATKSSVCCETFIPCIEVFLEILLTSGNVG